MFSAVRVQPPLPYFGNDSSVFFFVPVELDQVITLVVEVLPAGHADARSHGLSRTTI